MPGPLPTENPRRRNAPTIPTSKLPVTGRKGRAPSPPKSCTLRAAGKEWWAWAWKQPQACGWDDGALYVVARRASLEDDMAALHEVEGLNFTDVMDAESGRQARFAISRIAAMATGRLAVMKEMRELDDRLGLTPKGLAALRWKIVEPEEPPAATPARRRHLQAVDPSAVAQ